MDNNNGHKSHSRTPLGQTEEDYYRGPNPPGRDPYSDSFFDQLDPDLRRQQEASNMAGPSHESLEEPAKSVFPPPRSSRKYLHLDESNEEEESSEPGQRKSVFHNIPSGGKEADAAKGGDAPTFRKLYFNDKTRNAANKWLHNRISTAKYNFFTFIPKFLYEQFSKYANVFFFVISCIQV